MKKILATVLGVIFAMFAFAGCNMAAADGTTTGASGITSIVMMVVIIAVFYFLMIVPEKKRKKKAQEMRDSIEVGDKIVTIGGITGVIVDVKENRFVMETGADQVRIELEKWAVSTNETAAEAAKAQAEKDQEAKAKAKAAKKAEKNQ